MTGTAKILSIPLALVVLLLLFAPFAAAFAAPVNDVYGGRPAASTVPQPLTSAPPTEPGIPNTGATQNGLLPAAAASMLLALIWFGALSVFSAFYAFVYLRYRNYFGSPASDYAPQPRMSSSITSAVSRGPATDLV